MNIGSKYRAFNLVVVLTALMLLMFLFVGCGSSETDTGLDDDVNSEVETATDSNEESDQDVEESEAEQELSSDTPRSDTPVYPGAELVYESFFSAAVYEVYATDDSIDDVVQFYSEFPGFENVGDNVSPFGNHEGGYLETELWSLLFAGESTEVLQAEIEKSGRLIRFMIAPSDAQVIDALVGKEITPELGPDNTIIVSGVYTK
ncbi:MAG: hypothetical protein R6U08_04880 [Bacillota bacterium]